MQEAKAAQATTASAEPQRRALEEAQARAAALASELAGTRREIETQAAQSQKAVDEPVAGGGSTIAELRQTLQQEQKKTAALMQEAKAAQAMTTAAEQQRRALEEAQARPQPRERARGRNAIERGAAEAQGMATLSRQGSGKTGQTRRRKTPKRNCNHLRIKSGDSLRGSRRMLKARRQSAGTAATRSSQCPPRRKGVKRPGCWRAPKR